MVVDMTEIPKLDLDPFGNALFNFRNDLMRTFLESRAFSASKRFLIDQDFKVVLRPKKKFYFPLDLKTMLTKH